jgi:hypothetical protein
MQVMSMQTSAFCRFSRPTHACSYAGAESRKVAKCDGAISIGNTNRAHRDRTLPYVRPAVAIH